MLQNVDLLYLLIFEVLQKALGSYDEVKRTVKPKTRLADFEVWGEAISQSLGYEPKTFLAKYYAKQESDSISIQDTHPLATIIQRLMDDRESYEDTASECYETLVRLANGNKIDVQSQYVRFPKAPNQLTKELTVLIPALKRIGIKVKLANYTKSDGRFTKNSKIVSISKIDSLIESPSSPPSLGDYSCSDYGGDGEGSNKKEMANE